MDKVTWLMLTPGVEYSDPFELPIDGHLCLLAQGLPAGGSVTFEIVDITAAGPRGGACCPGTVALPEVVGTVSLRCRNGTVVTLTAAHPWLPLVEPHGALLRARLNVPDVDISTVTLSATAVKGPGAPWTYDIMATSVTP